MNIKQKTLWTEHVGFIAECVHAYVLSAVLSSVSDYNEPPSYVVRLDVKETLSKLLHACDMLTRFSEWIFVLFYLCFLCLVCFHVHNSYSSILPYSPSSYLFLFVLAPQFFLHPF